MFSIMHMSRCPIVDDDLSVVSTLAVNKMNYHGQVRCVMTRSRRAS